MPSLKPEGLSTHRSPSPCSHRHWASSPSRESRWPAQLLSRFSVKLPQTREQGRFQSSPVGACLAEAGKLLPPWVRAEDGVETPGNLGLGA